MFRPTTILVLMPKVPSDRAPVVRSNGNPVLVKRSCSSAIPERPRPDPLTKHRPRDSPQFQDDDS